MADRRPTLRDDRADPLLEALVELARSAVVNRREAEERRRTIHTVGATKGRSAA